MQELCGRTILEIPLCAACAQQQLARKIHRNDSECEQCRCAQLIQRKRCGAEQCAAEVNQCELHDCDRSHDEHKQRIFADVCAR